MEQLADLIISELGRATILNPYKEQEMTTLLENMDRLRSQGFLTQLVIKTLKDYQNTYAYHPGQFKDYLIGNITHVHSIYGGKNTELNKTIRDITKRITSFTFLIASYHRTIKEDGRHLHVIHECPWSVQRRYPCSGLEYSRRDKLPCSKIKTCLSTQKKHSTGFYSISESIQGNWLRTDARMVEPF